MEIIEHLKNSNREHVTEGATWIVWTLICGLLPLWGTVLLLTIFSQPIEHSHVSDNGEFLLYSASYLGVSLYIIMRDFNSRSFPSRPIIAVVLITLLLIVSLMFSGVTLNDLSGGETGKLNLDYKLIQTSGYWLFFIAIFLSFIITISENSLVNPDLDQMRAADLNDLENKFDEL